jgi:phosphatidylglycerol:prolipoprotein diacylglycerol transferase
MGIIVPMLPEIGHIGPITIRTYTLLLDLAILIGLGALAFQGRHTRESTRWLDIGLLALVGGIVGGRLEHVAIHWAYFIEHLNETYQIWNGGLGWHGAVLGGLVFLRIGCSIGKTKPADLLASLSITLPLGAALSYTGCLASHCAHGREVESLAGYPPFIAAELPDLYGIVAPRLDSQLFGIVFCVVLFAASMFLVRRLKKHGVRFWLVLILLGLGSFGIGFTRGDSNPMLGPLRLDQVLDLVVTVVGVVGTLRAARQPLPVKTPPGTTRHFDTLKPDA